MSFFFNDTATTEIYTLSLHDALPILPRWRRFLIEEDPTPVFEHYRQVVQILLWKNPVSPGGWLVLKAPQVDRKSTRLNSSHANISYAVFCLKKKKTQQREYSMNKT